MTINANAQCQECTWHAASSPNNSPAHVEHAAERHKEIYEHDVDVKISARCRQCRWNIPSSAGYSLDHIEHVVMKHQQVYGHDAA